jgi:hypothetical protein
MLASSRTQTEQPAETHEPISVPFAPAPVALALAVSAQPAKIKPWKLIWSNRLSPSHQPAAFSVVC